MKRRNVLIAALLALAGSFTMEMTAQSAIAAVVKKCETMKDVHINKATSRDKDSRKVTREITSITISNNPSLVNEIVAAFDKDKENALDTSESSANGKVTNIFYRFEHVSYSFSQAGEDGAIISVMAGDNVRYGGSVPRVAPASPRAEDRIRPGRTQ